MVEEILRYAVLIKVEDENSRDRLEEYKQALNEASQILKTSHEVFDKVFTPTRFVLDSVNDIVSGDWRSGVVTNEQTWARYVYLVTGSFDDDFQRGIHSNRIVRSRGAYWVGENYPC